MLRRNMTWPFPLLFKICSKHVYAIYSGILNWDINPEENPYMETTLRPKGAQYMKGQGFRKLKYMKE